MLRKFCVLLKISRYILLFVFIYWYYNSINDDCVDFFVVLDFVSTDPEKITSSCGLSYKVSA